MLLDGDDSLVNNNQIFQFYNNLYMDYKTEFSYGSCWSMVDNIPLVAQNYPEEIKQNRKYRDYKFNWNMPYTHLRTFLADLLFRVDDSNFKDENENWYKAGGDGAVFYTLIEQADPDKVRAVTDIVYNYNDQSPSNDYKVNGTEQTNNANAILNRKSTVVIPPALPKEKHPSVIQKTILIAIPTAKYIEPETMKSIYDLVVPDGYKTTFQYFYGYQKSQIRNLIAEWTKQYDYLLYVSRNSIIPFSFLKNAIEAGNQITLESNTWDVPVMDVCLIKSNVFRKVDYPWFEDGGTDTDFFNKMRNKGVDLCVSRNSTKGAVSITKC